MTGRFTEGDTMDKYGSTRAARFSLNSKKGGTFHGGVLFPTTFLDSIMKQIPGMNIYIRQRYPPYLHVQARDCLSILVQATEDEHSFTE